MEISDLSFLEVQKVFLKKIIYNNEYNKTIVKHYERLKSNYPMHKFDRKIDAIENCNQLWEVDHYQQQKVKDFKRTNLCKDKFCNNCKNVKQASRLTKFMPIIEELAKDKYLYHMVLTIPNCNGEDLSNKIKSIFKNFYSLNRYLNINLKIKGLDFEQYAYQGAIRSLEVTYRVDNYHPHLHCIISLDKPLNDNRYIVNTYSKSKKNGYRKFTDFEILIQKIWYLLNTGERVTKKAIDNLELGYSCTVDPIDKSSVYEVFKYMTKATDEKGNCITYNNFETLYWALLGVRQIQGYGCFYNVKDDDSIIDEANELYEVIVELLKAKENPLAVWQTVEDLLLDNDNLIISRKKIFNYLRELL